MQDRPNPTCVCGHRKAAHDPVCRYSCSCQRFDESYREVRPLTPEEQTAQHESWDEGRRDALDGRMRRESGRDFSPLSYAYLRGWYNEYPQVDAVTR